MELQAFLRLLHVDHGPSASGEYACRCPAHDDHTASLCVRQGSKGILVDCKAGCDTKAVVAKLGLTMKDLFPTDSTPAKAKATGIQKAKPTFQPQGKRELGKLTKVYTYTDEDGQPIFEVCRYEQEKDGKRSKTFLQRHYAPSHLKAKKDGYVWSTDGLRHPLYRLHEVVKAIREGKPVYVVEGEKDADNLAALGFAATTNPGGASKKDQQTKWTQEHTDTLIGAEVIILPDIDETGTTDRRKVTKLLIPGCKSVRLLDLTQAGIPLPEKGDITDLFQSAGKKKGLEALARLVADAKPLTLEDLADSYEGAITAIRKIPGYTVEDGCICKRDSEGSARKLCTFVAAPRAEITRDDGVNTETIMLIDGWNRHGTPLPQVRTSSRAFKSLGWVTDNWGFQGNIMPGSTTTDNLRYAIAAVGEAAAKRYTEYSHTGWRKIHGKWAYLFQGGAIGADNISVELGIGLSAYRLDGDGSPEFDAIQPIEGLAMSYALTSVMARHISIPLLALTYLAPLKDALARQGCGPAFSLFLVGDSGSGKSTAAALALSHYGTFDAQSLPASFHDTANYIQKKAFLLKDVPLVVDDYHPTTSAQERRKMDNTAQNLARTFGDSATRKRMNSDTSLREDTPPRCVSIISGEYTPDIGESGVARFYVVQVEGDDVPKNDALTLAQDTARRGYLQKAMRGYIEWLLPQMDALPEQLAQRFQALRADAQRETGKKVHARMPEAVACLALGYEMFTRYMAAMGVMDEETAEAEQAAAWQIILSNSQRQADEAKEERPGRAFLAVMGELLTAKVAAVRDMTDIKAYDPTRGMVGYMDAEYYYLLPDIAYSMVAEQTRKKGQELALTQRSLYRQMRRDGLIAPPNDSEVYSYPKRVTTTESKRVLWIPRALIDGPQPYQEQLRIAPEHMRQTGFTPVNDSDLPKEWTSPSNEERRETT